MTLQIHPDHPLPQYRSADKGVAHLKTLLAARTDSDGNAKPGWKRNVAAIRHEIAVLEGRPTTPLDAGPKSAA